jgi:hypothetical protein
MHYSHSFFEIHQPTAMGLKKYRKYRIPSSTGRRYGTTLRHTK